MDCVIPDKWDVQQWARDIVIEEMQGLVEALRKRSAECSVQINEEVLSILADVIAEIYPERS